MYGISGPANSFLGRPRPRELMAYTAHRLNGLYPCQGCPHTWPVTPSPPPMSCDYCCSLSDLFSPKSLPLLPTAGPGDDSGTLGSSTCFSILSIQPQSLMSHHGSVFTDFGDGMWTWMGDSDIIWSVLCMGIAFYPGQTPHLPPAVMHNRTHGTSP